MWRARSHGPAKSTTKMGKNKLDQAVRLFAHVFPLFFFWNAAQVPSQVVGVGKAPAGDGVAVLPSRRRHGMELASSESFQRMVLWWFSWYFPSHTPIFKAMAWN